MFKHDSSSNGLRMHRTDWARSLNQCGERGMQIKVRCRSRTAASAVHTPLPSIIRSYATHVAADRRVSSLRLLRRTVI